MKNTNQCETGLQYPDFTIIFIQTFTSAGITIPAEGWLQDGSQGNFDDQLFLHKKEIIKRYILPGFKIRVVVGDESDYETVEGEVAVWATQFFDTTMEISYRFIVHTSPRFKDMGFMTASAPLDTDKIIALAGIVQHVEHWVFKEKENMQIIDGCVREIEISDFPFSPSSSYLQEADRENGISFDEARRRYRNVFDKTGLNEFRYEEHDFTFIDIWETIEHYGIPGFRRMDEDEIIEHIETRHRAELVGLMSLYPKEWPYRMDSSYVDICGPNIAIDTDDLVLANENMSIVLGTYGRRGEDSATNWIKHLKRRDKYHVCWPEYLTLIEILLAKKMIINYVLNKYICNSKDAADRKTHKIIEQNARLSIKMTDMLTELDSIRYLRYISHKHMYNMTAERLRISRDEEELRHVIEHIERSLNNANAAAELNENDKTKHILFFISVASLFGVLLEGNGIAPIYALISDEWGSGVALTVVILTTIGILIGLYHLFGAFTRWLVKYIRIAGKKIAGYLHGKMNK